MDADDLKAIDLKHCEIGTVASRADHSVSFRVNTPELRPSESGTLMRWHGRSCRVAIFPNEGEHETVEVTTERDQKSAATRLRNTLFVLWKQQHADGKPDFDTFYRLTMENIINRFKEKLNPI